MGIYCGARGAARIDELAQLERRGMVAEVKADGCYVEFGVGIGGVVTWGRYRSGRPVKGASGRDLIGLKTPWPPGTVLAGELMTSTPAAARWQAEHRCAGVVLFDVLAWGDAKQVMREWARGTLWSEALPALDCSSQPQAARRAILERLIDDLDGKARRVLHLVEMRRRGLRAWFEDVVGAGGEGVVVKDPAAPAGRGTRKVKRSDSVTCRVVRVIEDERCAVLDWGGISFSLNLPRFPIAVGQLVDLRARGFYDSGVPRHAAIERVRDDLA